MSLFEDWKLRRRAGDLLRQEALRRLPRQSELEHLRAAGEVRSATGSFADLPRPFERDPAITSPSELLRQQRDERL